MGYTEVGDPITVFKKINGCSGVPCEWNQTLSLLFYFSFYFFPLSLATLQALLNAYSNSRSLHRFHHNAACMLPAMELIPFLERTWHAVWCYGLVNSDATPTAMMQ